MNIYIIMKNKDYTIMIRLTEEDDFIAKQLRKSFDINISSLVRNAIRKKFKDVGGIIEK